MTNPPPSPAKRHWAIAVAVLAVLVALGAGVFYLVVNILKDSEAYRLGVERLQANHEAMAMLGPPLKTGFPSGSISTSGPAGQAQLAIPVEGSKASGVLYVEATKDMGQWKVDRIVLDIEGMTERIDLNRRGTSI